MTDRCFYFGCWNTAGHYLVGPGGRRTGLPDGLAYRLSEQLNSLFAPKLAQDGSIIFGRHDDSKDWARYSKFRGSEECPQGHFLRHELLGFTLIQWWDRCQGDERPNCNSTILLEGIHTSEEMLAALAEHFPHVLANLEKAGVKLVEVQPEVE